MKKDIRTEAVFLSSAFIKEKTTCTLLSDIAKLSDDIVTKKTKTCNLQAGARRVLAYLAVKDGVSQLDLIHVTHLKAPTISLIVQKMEHDGIVSRRADDVDMRLTRVYLTDAGKAMNERINTVITEVENTAMSGFSEDEKVLFHNLLVRAYRNMEEASFETE